METEGLPDFFTGTLPSQGLFEPFSLPGLQIEGVLPDVFDDVFLLNPTLESTQGTLKRLPILNSHICHEQHPLRSETNTRIIARSFASGTESRSMLYLFNQGTQKGIECILATLTQYVDVLRIRVDSTYERD